MIVKYKAFKLTKPCKLATCHVFLFCGFFSCLFFYQLKRSSISALRCCWEMKQTGGPDRRCYSPTLGGSVLPAGGGWGGGFLQEEEEKNLVLFLHH